MSMAIILCLLLVVVQCREGPKSYISDNALPFTCPYEVPKENTKGFNPGLLGSEGTDLTKVSTNFYAEYRAAQALVPSDATAMRVFNEEELNKDYTVAVIFVYDSSVNKLKKWLK